MTYGYVAMFLAFCCHFRKEISDLKYHEMQISRDASVDNFFPLLNFGKCSLALNYVSLITCRFFPENFLKPNILTWLIIPIVQDYIAGHCRAEKPHEVNETLVRRGRETVLGTGLRRSTVNLVNFSGMRYVIVRFWYGPWKLLM